MMTHVEKPPVAEPHRVKASRRPLKGTKAGYSLGIRLDDASENQLHAMQEFCGSYRLCEAGHDRGHGREMHGAGLWTVRSR